MGPSHVKPSPANPARQEHVMPLPKDQHKSVTIDKSMEEIR